MLRRTERRLATASSDVLQALQACLKKKKEAGDGGARAAVVPPVGAAGRVGSGWAREADEATAQHLRFTYVRHAKKPWAASYAQSRNLRRALMKDFVQCQRAGKVGPKSYEIVASFFAVLGMAERCRRVVAEAPSYTPNLAASLISCLAKKGDVVAVLREVRRLIRWRGASSVPSLVADKVHTAAVAVLLRGGRGAECVKVASLRLVSDTYALVLSACRNHGQVSACLSEMEGRGVEVKAVHYAGAAASCGADVEHALQVLHRAEASREVRAEVYCAVAASSVKAGDFDATRRIASRAHAAGAASPLLQYLFLSAALDTGSPSLCRRVYAAGHASRHGEALRTVSQTLLCVALTGDAKGVLRSFDIRPLGKYTATTLMYLETALRSCLVAASPSSRFAFSALLTRQVPTEALLFLLAYHCFALRGYGSVALARVVVEYDARRRRGKRGEPPPTPGTYRLLGKALALKGGVAATEVLLEVFGKVLDDPDGGPARAAMLLPPLLAACGSVGAVDAAREAAVRLLSHPSPCWSRELSPHFDVLSGIGVPEHILRPARNLWAAQASSLYSSLTAPDVLFAEHSVLAHSLTSSIPKPPTCPSPPRSHNAASVEELLRILSADEKEGEEEKEEEGYSADGQPSPCSSGIHHWFAAGFC